MDRGLDELIESLLTEIAFSGSRGCSVTDLVKAVNSYYNNLASSEHPAGSEKPVPEQLAVPTNELAPGNKAKVNAKSNDLGLPSKVWGWLVVRNDVSVGLNRKFNHLPLEEVLRICEREKAASAAASSEASIVQESPSNSGSSRPGKKPQKPDGVPESAEPRLYVSEERQWKTLTGHGPDFKRIPLFEWKALVDIASVKEKGILQGDLVRLTGQDKRSLPTRTDALAKKGYIIKQPILLRGFRSSKIWLKQYAESAQEEAKREGLPLEELDLSKEASMQDLNPVSFNNHWNGDRLDYLAIAQGFIAITKAWGIIRYCDLRTKMGVDERVPQMRALAKSSRWFTNIGAVTFVAARFANSSKLFKDCVKFLRDPTPDEWKKFRSIPTNHIKAPSSRIGKRGQNSRDNAKLKASKAEKTEDIQQAKRSASKASDELLDQMEVTSSSWIPQKPFVNTVFDIIKRNGAEGTSNNVIRHQTLGYNYRKFIASMNASLSSPLVETEQPEFRVTSQLTRVGKTMSYQFFAPGGAAAPSKNNEEIGEGQAQAQEAENALPADEWTSQAFSVPDPSKFTTNSSISLSQLCQPLLPTSKPRTNGKFEGFRKEYKATTVKRGAKKPRGRPPKKLPTAESLDTPEAEPQENSQSKLFADNVSNDKGIGGSARTRRKPKNLEGVVVIPDDADLEELNVESPAQEDNTHTSAERRAPPLPDTPGVYRGLPNSLDPVKKQGRPRKSIVVILKSDKLKDPTSHGETAAASLEIEDSVVEPGEPEASKAPVPPSSVPRRLVSNDESVVSAEPDHTPTTRGSMKPTKVSRSDSKKGFKCEKCGQTWKNSNGLEYHINKSQTPCNPLYVQSSPWQRKSLPVARARPQSTHEDRRRVISPHSQTSPSPPQRASENQNDTESPHPEQTLPDEGPVVSTTPDASSKLGNVGRSIVLQDVEVYNVTSRLRGRRRSKSRLSEAFSSESLQLPRKRQKISQDISASSEGVGPTQPPNSKSPREDTTPPSENVEQRESGVPDNSPQSIDAASNQGNEIKVPQKRRAMSPVSTDIPSEKAVLDETPRKRRKLSQQKPIEPDIDAQKDLPEEQATPSNQNVAIPVPPDSTESQKADKTSPAKTMLHDFMLRPTASESTARTAVLQETPTAVHPNHQELQKPVETHDSNPVSNFIQVNSISRNSTTKYNGVSEGTLRRERTSEIIEYLLDENDGVFPGELSLYIIVASLWARRFDDLKPPDRKIVQQTVNRMEKECKLKQLHYFFLDSKGDSKGICVVAKVTSGDSKAEELSRDPRVVCLKDKIREVYPEIYIPPTFPLSPQESELYSALLDKAKESAKESSKRGRRADPATASTSTHEVEVMHYPQPVMTNIDSAGDSFVSGFIADENFAKRSRRDNPAFRVGPISLKESHKPRGIQKPRKRAPLRDYWDTGKVATYIWSQNHTPMTTWDQKPACLQDPATGTWSSTPQVLTSSDAEFDRLLSFIKTGKLPRKPGRPRGTRKNPNHALASRKRTFRRNATKWGADDEESIGDNDEPSASNDPFVKPSTTASFLHSNLNHDDNDSDSAEDDSVMLSSQEATSLEDDSDDNTSIRFGDIKEIESYSEGYWPLLSDDFFRSKKTSFSMNGSMPTTQWFHQVNLPHSTDDILNIARWGQIKTSVWADKAYAEFVRRANAVRNWERSPHGSRVLQMAPVKPGSIFIDLGVNDSKITTQPMVLDWSQEAQYTIEDLPGEIKYGIHDDQDAGLSDTDGNQVQPVKPVKPTKPPKPTRKSRQRKAREFKHPFNVNLQSGDGEFDYKTRNLTALPPSQQGRVNKSRPSNDAIRHLGDTAIITAIVVVKSLLGGVEGTIDYGLILKIFPEKSFTRLKNFWPKACKQRKRFVDALTEKFQSSFLEAYEKGELPLIDFDNPEDYDWVSLIIWASKLETHQDVDLPQSREELDEMYLLDDPDDQVIDWKEVWFSNVAVHTRIEANIAKPATVPVCMKQDEDPLILRARSYIRSLCTTSMAEVGAPNRVMRKLLELGNGSEKETNDIFAKVVAQLTEEKIATRGKSKKFGFRLNYNFDRIVEKSANTEKFLQAAAFKSRLDEAFRSHGEMFLPYAADDGSIMAVINLQAYGRICMEPVDLPDIPFGFEPGNYEGRSYPKSYYHWKIRLAPTATYLYDEDMPLLGQARRAGIPERGPYGASPIWLDLLGRVDSRRWAEYVCMLTFALATKGPLTADSAATILKPVIEPFEADLIIDFLDHLGLIQRVYPLIAPGGKGEASAAAAIGGSAGEWWWLAVGQLIDVKGKGAAVS